jgi:glycine hydroxymethyltransferase
LLDEQGITLNFNTIPDDPRPPYRASGLRIGTPAVTTQGMKELEVSEVASLMARALKERDDETALREVRERIGELASEFTPYPTNFSGHV